MSERAPVAMMSARALSVGSGAAGSPIQTPIGAEPRSTLDALSVTDLGPEALGLGPHRDHELGPQHAMGEAGEVLDLGRQHELAARLVARGRGLTFEHERAADSPRAA